MTGRPSTDDCRARTLDANRRLIKYLRHERHALFDFLAIDGVDATNWRAEQGVRPAVVNHEGWGGNRTDRGTQTPGRLMTFLRTAHQQGAEPSPCSSTLARPADPDVVAGLAMRSG